MLWWNLYGVSRPAGHIEGISAVSRLLFREVGLEEVRLEILNRIIDEFLGLFSSLTIDVELLQLVLLDDCAFGLQNLRKVVVIRRK